MLRRFPWRRVYSSLVVVFFFGALLATAWVWVGVPRSVGAGEIEEITGLSIPESASMVKSRYQKGLRTRTLLAEFEIGEADPETVVGQMLPGIELSRDPMEISRVHRWHAGSPRWWPRLEDVTLAGRISARSKEMIGSRSDILVVSDGEDSHARVFLCWSEAL